MGTKIGPNYAKGPVIKYLLGGVEDILGGYEKKSEPLRGVPKY